MSKVVACIIARTVSTRVPLKVLRHLKPGMSMLDVLISRLKLVNGIDEIVLCTSEEAVDDILEDVAEVHKIQCYRGSADRVIERMITVGDGSKADIVIRITGDNPLTTIEYLDQMIAFLRNEQLDYVRMVNVPIGATPEVIRFSALKRCYSIMDPDVSEYLMLYIFEPEQFKCGIIQISSGDYSNLSMTVDTPSDLERTKLLLHEIDQPVTQITLLSFIKALTDNALTWPAVKIGISGSVKYPYNKLISWDEYAADMERRKKGSLLKQLS